MAVYCKKPLGFLGLEKWSWRFQGQWLASFNSSVWQVSCFRLPVFPLQPVWFGWQGFSSSIQLFVSSILPCPSLLFVVVINTMPKRNSEERVYKADSPSPSEIRAQSRQEPGGRANRDLRGTLFTRLLPLACSATFVILPMDYTTHSGLGSPTSMNNF